VLDQVPLTGGEHVDGGDFVSLPPVHECEGPTPVCGTPTSLAARTSSLWERAFGLARESLAYGLVLGPTSLGFSGS
jgi:hypothetical protein